MTNPAWTQTEIVIRTAGFLSICFIVICTQTVICSSVSLLYFFIHLIIYSFILYSDYFALICKGHFRLHGQFRITEIILYADGIL